MESCSNTWCFVMAFFSLSVMFSRVYLCSIPFYCWIMFHRMYTPHFVYTLLGWWAFGFFLPFELFWVMLLWTVNTGFYVTCVFISLEHVPGSGVGRSFGNTMLSILKTCRVVFRNSCPSSPSLAGSGGVPASLHLHRCLWLFVFLILAVLVCVWSGVSLWFCFAFA